MDSCEDTTAKCVGFAETSWLGPKCYWWCNIILEMQLVSSKLAEELILSRALGWEITSNYNLLICKTDESWCWNLITNLEKCRKGIRRIVCVVEWNDWRAETVLKHCWGFLFQVREEKGLQASQGEHTPLATFWFDLNIMHSPEFWTNSL